MSSKILSTHTDLALDSTARARMIGQNRFRFLNSIVSAKRSAAQTISNNTWTLCTWDAEYVDTDTLHDNSTNPSRLTAAIAGKYVVAANLIYANNSTGNYRIIDLEKNASGTFAAGTIYAQTSSRPVTSAGTAISVAAIISLSAGDYVELFTIQDSGGNLDVNALSNFSMTYIGE